MLVGARPRALPGWGALLRACASYRRPPERCALPRAAEEDRRHAGGGGAPSAAPAQASPAAQASAADGGGAAAPAAEALEQKSCHLEWNAAGDRLLGVGSRTGVSLWAVGEGRAAPSVVAVPTDTARTRAVTGAFVSAASVVATGGRRGDPDGGVSPHAAAGLCVWDTLAPPGSSLVAHDAGADAASAMPPEYTCLAWAAGRRSILCGTKAGELRVFDLRQQRVSHRIAAHKAAIRYCFVLEASGRLATLSTMSEMKIWNLEDMECLESWRQLHSSRGMGMGGVLGKSQVLACAGLLSDWHLVTGGQDGSLLLTRV
ncbi:unnamed protein product [Prorocentrum cordatum]|uniref:Anaphase-promoting complex subunit 4 WD40 domain-containing protein n=1 Tax=Prorocentrum cordatum TaxID=2364126 RepID=A0ABN9Q7E1_9DINO|nr:unnamed protein product [Polarella glacialis]